MEDEDSGIFQSKIEDISLGENDLIKYEKPVTTSSPFEETLTESDDSDLDALSSLSDDDLNESSSDDFDNGCYLHLLDEKENQNCNNSKYRDGKAPSTMQPSTEKKRLSIDEPFSNRQDVNSLGEQDQDSSGFFKSFRKSLKRSTDKNKEKMIGDLYPGMKITYKDGERDEHWEFDDGTISRRGQSQPSVKGEIEISPKRILKLQLSAGKNSADSDDGNVEIKRMHESKDCRDAGVENRSKTVQFELRDPDKLQCSEWRRMFDSCPEVKITQQVVLDGVLDHDAVIIPGNSFGFLDGEPEIQFTRRFGWKLQEDLQKIIRDKHDGELLVGQAIILSLENCGSAMDEIAEPGMPSHHDIGYAIYVPVMRVPLQVGDTVNAYLAFRAALKEVKSHNEQDCKGLISTILCPSLCNGFGSMPAGRIALQMKTAFDAVTTGNKRDIINPKGLGAMATNHVEMTTKIGNWC